MVLLCTTIVLGDVALQGYEAMHMLRKGQVKGVGKGDILGQVRFAPACLEWLPKLDRKDQDLPIILHHTFLQHSHRNELSRLKLTTTIKPISATRC